jgi:hypothetical protein
MGFWNKLFGKKVVPNSFCTMCENQHFKKDADFINHEPIVIDGVSYADEYCSKECEEAAKLKVHQEPEEIEVTEGGEDDATQ